MTLRPVFLYGAFASVYARQTFMCGSAPIAGRKMVIAKGSIGLMAAYE